MGDQGNIFARRGGAWPAAYGQPTLYSRTRLLISQTMANALSSIFLILVVIWALSVRILAAIPRYLTGQNKYEPRGWDDPHKWKKEALVKDVRYYAKSAGFEIINETVETADGYYLRMHRVVDPTRAHERHSDGRGE